MSDFPLLDETQKFKLTEAHRLTVEAHAAVMRLESSRSGGMETGRIQDKCRRNLEVIFPMEDF